VSFLKNKWVVIAVACLCGALLGAFAAGFYYYQYEDLRSRISGVLTYVNVGIDYGNFTRVWHNHTEALTGATLFDVTKHVASVDYNVTILLGTEITEINGLRKQGSFGWTYWVRHSNSTSWEIVWTGVDKYVIVGNEIFMWYYTNGFNPPP
jgi:hypothetical protein